MSNHIYPSLRYRDARAAIDFLERAFGFEVVVAHENDAGMIVHAELRWGDAMVMLGQETEAGIAKHGAHAGQGWNYVTVDDADAHYTRAKEAGAEITMELIDLDYGSRDYARWTSRGIAGASARTTRCSRADRFH